MAIERIYLDNINQYKDRLKYVDNKIMTRKDKNELVALFYIIIQMYHLYGCPECKTKGCKCGILPRKHPCIPGHVCHGDTPWGSG